MKKQIQSPSVAIAIAIYHPNLAWLREQLRSLDAQDYPQLSLVAWVDDPASDIHAIEQIFSECVKTVPFQILRPHEHLGTVGAFDALTQAVEADYIAYCDQDDVWLPEKISTLMAFSRMHPAHLVCSDVLVIDGEGKELAKSITDIRPRQRFYAGDDLPEYLLTKNFVMGCTTLVKTETAKACLPFPKTMMHDWWLALCVSLYGTLRVYHRPLLQYRIHGANQSGILSGIHTKQEYFEQRILPFSKRMQDIARRLRDTALAPCLGRYLAWAQARVAYHRAFRFQTLYQLWTLRCANLPITLFEICMKFLPECLFRFAVRQIQKGNI